MHAVVLADAPQFAFGLDLSHIHELAIYLCLCSQSRHFQQNENREKEHAIRHYHEVSVTNPSFLPIPACISILRLRQYPKFKKSSKGGFAQTKNAHRQHKMTLITNKKNLNNRHQPK